MNIVLKFNKKNNFCPINKKYGTSGERIEIAKTALWVVNCARSAIEKSYEIGSPRQIEMEQLHADLYKQLRKQLTKDECEELKINVEPLILGL